MQWDARGTVALLVSAVVGIAAGVILGFSTGSPGSSRADPPAGEPSSTLPSSADPLRVGVALQNLDCTTEAILVVGYGDSSLPIIEAVTSNPDGVRYLETAKSCNTLYGPEGEGESQPKYVAYLGPFDSLREPCELRMNLDHKGDAVTQLKPGKKIHVPCLCVLEPEDLPKLAVGMNASTRDGIFIRALQQFLVDIGVNPDRHITGRYDQKTADMIIELQKLNDLNPHGYGIVGRLTWLQVRDRACLKYDF